MSRNNVDKAMEARDGKSLAKEIKLAEKDHDVLEFDFENDLLQAIKDSFEQNGKPGETLSDYIKRVPINELKKINLRDGGSVDFKGLTVSDMKAIFRSENGYDPRTPKELVRGVRMYLKGLDLDGLPYGVFEKKGN